MTRRKFKHLSFTDRLKIEAGLKMKMSAKQIADNLGVHISTVYREIKRGVYMRKEAWKDRYGYETRYRYKETYSPDMAEQKYRDSLAAKGAPLKIGKDHALADYLERKIVDEGWTVSAVLGEIKRKRLPFSTSICVRTLYSYIEKGVFLRLSLRHLPFQGKRNRHVRHVLPAKAPRGESIEKRPAVVAERLEFGHWEMDTVVGKKGTKQVLLVLTERKTRYEIVCKIKSKSQYCVVKELDKIERKMGAKKFRETFKTITCDNGCENLDFEGIERSAVVKRKRTKVFYAHPYSAWERGSNENANKLIRRFIPKGADIGEFSHERIKMIEHWINNYPRRLFNGLSSDLLIKRMYVA